MNTPLIAASGITVVVAAAHALLGERMIFRSGVELPARFRGIIRATWHVTSLLGLGLAVIMLSHALSGNRLPEMTKIAITASMALSSLAVLAWTRGRHPGWFGLGSVALLCAFS